VYFSYGSGDYKKEVPHVRFSNATDDDRLRRFAKTFGPVWLPPKGKFEWDEEEGELTAIEHLPSLREEHRSVRAVARIIAIVSSPGRPRTACENLPKTERASCSQLQDEIEIAESLLSLGDSWRKDEIEVRRSLQGLAVRLRLLAVRDLAQSELLEEATRLVREEKLQFLARRPRVALLDVFSLLADLLNHFPLQLVATYTRPNLVELPETTDGGIRPALYNMLRTDLLNAARGRAALGLCPECDDFFSIGRAGAVFCSSTCAVRFDSRRHWREKGNRRRRQRRLTGQPYRRRATRV
jgi:hypothetical protein